MTKVTPFETYKAFIALKTHFCKDGYDYIQHRSQRIKAKPESFYKRKDRHYFERLSRQYKDPDCFFSKLSIVPNHKRPIGSIFPSLSLLLGLLGSIDIE